MNKGILIKVAIVLAVLMLAHSVFWFFRLGQSEKQINKFISENSSNISLGEVSVSGFPFSQKITLKDLKFTIPTQVLDKKQIIIKELSASAGLMSSNFIVDNIDQISIHDLEGEDYLVEMNSKPSINFFVKEGRIIELSYLDTGYKVLDQNKNLINSFESTKINVVTSFEDGGNIISKIIANINITNNLDLASIYKNTLEKKVVDGIKTGEITLSPAVNQPNNLDFSLNNNTINHNQPVASQVTPNQITAQDNTHQAIPNQVATPEDPNNQVTNSPANQPIGDESVIANANQNTDPNQPSQEILANNQDVASTKNTTIAISFDYILSPINQVENSDPTQLQENPTQYGKLFKISQLEISNSSYKVSISGEMNIASDDSTPYGGLTIVVEKIDNLISQFNSDINKIINNILPSANVDNSVPTDAGLMQQAQTQDPYQEFLKRVQVSLLPTTKEIASKSLVTKENISQFDIRREKNLDFLINETPIREIIGKL